MTTQSKRTHPDIARRKDIIKAWRKVSGVGRLYWNKAGNKRWSWPAGAVAMAKNGAERTYFDSLEAVETYIAPTSIAARITRMDSTESMPAKRKGRG